MKNREYFLREDLDTFKRKFKAVCRETKLEIKKYSDSLAQEENNCYISRIIIKEK
jgi:hypothetical protein